MFSWIQKGSLWAEVQGQTSKYQGCWETIVITPCQTPPITSGMSPPSHQACYHHYYSQGFHPQYTRDDTSKGIHSIYHHEIRYAISFTAWDKKVYNSHMHISHNISSHQFKLSPIIWGMPYHSHHKYLPSPRQTYTNKSIITTGMFNLVTTSGIPGCPGYFTMSGMPFLSHEECHTNITTLDIEK